MAFNAIILNPQCKIFIAGIQKDRALYLYQLYEATWLLYKETTTHQRGGFVAPLLPTTCLQNSIHA